MHLCETFVFLCGKDLSDYQREAKYGNLVLPQSSTKNCMHLCETFVFLCGKKISDYHGEAKYGNVGRKALSLPLT